jgi:hypothetical protein
MTIQQWIAAAKARKCNTTLRKQANKPPAKRKAIEGKDFPLLEENHLCSS